MAFYISELFFIVQLRFPTGIQEKIHSSFRKGGVVEVSENVDELGAQKILPFKESLIERCIFLGSIFIDKPAWGAFYLNRLVCRCKKEARMMNKITVARKLTIGKNASNGI